MARRIYRGKIGGSIRPRTRAPASVPGLDQSAAEHFDSTGRDAISDAVAAALRNVGRRYFQSRGRDHKVARKVDVNSPEVQQLIQAAVPLIQQLSNDQKREVRQLVRIIGLETVAAQI